VGFYGLNIWLPTILKGASGWSDLKVTIVAMIPHLAGLVGMLVFGWSSDRTGERRWHAAGAIMLGAVGYLLVVAAGGNPFLVVAALCVVAGGARRCPAAGAITRGAAVYLLVVAAGGNPFLVVAAFCVVAAGADGYFPGFLPLPTAVLTESGAAGSIGLINSVGNLGGFVGPYILGYVRTTTNSFNIGLALLALSMLIGSGCVLSVRHVRK